MEKGTDDSSNKCLRLSLYHFHSCISLPKQVKLQLQHHNTYHSIMTSCVPVTASSVVWHGMALARGLVSCISSHPGLAEEQLPSGHQPYRRAAKDVYRCGTLINYLCRTQHNAHNCTVSHQPVKAYNIYDLDVRIHKISFSDHPLFLLFMFLFIKISTHYQLHLRIVLPF